MDMSKPLSEHEKRARQLRRDQKRVEKDLDFKLDDRCIEGESFVCGHDEIECKHEVKYLVGMADGIHCRNCGKILPGMPAAEKAEPKKPAPKKGGKTSARKQ